MAVIIVDKCMVVTLIIYRIKTFKMQHSCKCIKRDIKSSLLKIIHAELCFFDEQFGKLRKNLFFLYLHYHGILWVNKSSNLYLVTLYQWYLLNLVDFQTNEIVFDNTKGFLSNEDYSLLLVIPMINPKKSK